MMVFYVLFGRYCHGWDILFRKEEKGLILNSKSLVEELQASALLSLVRMVLVVDG